MYRRVIYSTVVLALMLAMTLPFAAVARAQTTTSLVMWFVARPGVIYSDGTLYYTVGLSNSPVPGANDIVVDVYFRPPGPSGAAGAYGPPILLDAAKRIEVGETVIYNWDGQDDALARPVLAVDLEAVPLDPGVTLVYAAAEYEGEYVHSPAYDANESRSIAARIIRPDRKTTIAASPITAASGDLIELTVADSNTGDNRLTDVSVTVNDGASDIAVLTAPPDGGDANADGILDPGETWTWTIAGVAVSTDTTFTATGYGQDSLGNAVTYPVYAGARASVAVTVDVSGPGIRLRKLVNGHEAHEPTGPVVPVGSSVSFEYIVTNIGDVDLAPVVVNDDVLGDIGTIPSLSAGASRTLSTTAPALAGQHSSVGTATGTSPTGVLVSDSDTGCYYGSVTAPHSGSEPRPVNRLAILVLWVVLGAAIIAGAVILVRRRGVKP